jgi:hypothetical protein
MILSKLQLVENILTELSDNSNGQISPYDIRHNLLDIVDSVHLLLNEHDIKAKNFDTPHTRTTRAGENTLENLSLNGYFSVDNSAFGFAALKSNYQGSRNTAVGSNSLSCNIYGEDNSAIGYNALAGNTIGFGNVGIGSYSLNNNKLGNFNVAIGNAAGYYVDRFTSNKLFIASHPVDANYICNNPLGSGLQPLVYGDFEAGQLGISVDNLDSSGILQVGGDITPSSGNSYNLGNTSYSWNNLYVNNVNFLSGIYVTSNNGNITTNTNIVPSTNAISIGTESNPWSGGYFDNIVVNGVATFNRFNAYETCEYYCKTIYLASSGIVESLDGGGPTSIYDYAYQNPLVYQCSLITDEEMMGAGFIASTSGTGYRRDYRFVFLPPASGLTCDNNGHARASWYSNTSISLDSGVYLRTNRIVSYDNNCHGLYFDDGRTYVGRKNILDARPSSSNGNIAGVGNTNFLGNSGVYSDYIATFAALESGVSVSTRLLTNTKNRTKDSSNNNKDRLTGFEFKFIDTSAQNLSVPSDRLVIGSYNNTSTMLNTVSLMKDASQGIFGINGLGVLSENIVPKTALDIRTTGNAIIRSTAENQSRTVAALQLLGEQSCEYRGVELAYLNTSGVADLSMYKDSGRQVFFRLYDNNTVGLFTSSGTSNAMLTIVDNFRNTAAISIREHASSPSATSLYSKLYVKQKTATNQSQSLYTIDSSGNVHDLVVNKFDGNDARAVFTDSLQNTFAGMHSPNNRILTQATSNSSLGYRSLYSLSTGDFNSVVGTESGSGINTGSHNTIVGSHSSRSITSGSNNIVIGSSGFNSTSSSASHNIIIGNSGIGNSTSGDYNFVLGSRQNLVLLQGTLGPSNTDKQLSMPSGGKLNIFDNTNSDSLSLRANVVEVRDFSGNNYPDNTLSFKFTGNQSSDLLLLKHHVLPLTNTPTYDTASNNRPHAELRGDLRLLGSVRFSDGTSINSSPQGQINSLSSSVSGVNSQINNLANTVNSLFVEGTASVDILPPSSPATPTSGNMLLRNQNWYDVGNAMLYNRDKALKIKAGDYVIAIRINNEYRPIWVSDQDPSCTNCH